MRTFKFVANPEQNKILARIVGICAWIESDEGFFILLHESDRGYLGQTAQSHLGELHHLIQSLFDKWTEADFIIDLSKWRFPLDAYCQVHEVLRQIEVERNLPKDTLSSRIFIPSYDGSSDEEAVALEAWRATRIPVQVKIIAKSAPQVNPVSAAFERVGI